MDHLETEFIFAFDTIRWLNYLTVIEIGFDRIPAILASKVGNLHVRDDVGTSYNNSSQFN